MRQTGVVLVSLYFFSKFVSLCHALGDILIEFRAVTEIISYDIVHVGKVERSVTLDNLLRCCTRVVRAYYKI
ncbi:MAG TPA: hypothetical protein VF914_02650 [Chloroflexia bacterium]